MVGLRKRLESMGSKCHRVRYQHLFGSYVLPHFVMESDLRILYVVLNLYALLLIEL